MHPAALSNVHFPFWKCAACLLSCPDLHYSSPSSSLLLFPKNLPRLGSRLAFQQGGRERGLPRGREAPRCEELCVRERGGLWMAEGRVGTAGERAVCGRLGGYGGGYGAGADSLWTAGWVRWGCEDGLWTADGSGEQTHAANSRHIQQTKFKQFRKVPNTTATFSKHQGHIQQTARPQSQTGTPHSENS